MADTLSPFRPRHKEYTARSVTEFRSVRIERARIRQHLALPFLLSSALSLIAAITSAVGTFNPGIFRDPAMTAGNARGTSLVILAVAVPLLIGSMLLTSLGSVRAGIVWLGSLGYILYNSALFAFAVSFNRLFLLYVAMFGLALWALVTTLMQVDAESLREHFRATTPTRGIAIYLILSAVFFAVAWMRDIVPALVNNTVPNSLDKTLMLTNVIEVVDLTISLPLMALAGYWIWQRRSWGYLLSGTLLVMFTIETLSVAVDQIFGHRSDPTQSLAAVPLMVGLTAAGLLVTLVYMRYLREEIS